MGSEHPDRAEQTEPAARRKWPYPLRGFLLGVGIAVVAYGVLYVIEADRQGQLDPYTPRAILFGGEVGEALAIGLCAGLIGMLVGVIISDRQKTAELRCPCGYLLKGLTGDRCPECGRPIPDKPRRKKPYQQWGFLIGFGIVYLLALLLVIAFTGCLPGFGNYDPTTKSIVTGFLMLSLAIAVGTGLIGMQIGYGIYRWRCRIS